MTDETRAQIIAHAEACYPHESCGLVSDGPGGEKYHPASNAEATWSGFLLDPRDQFRIMREAERQGRKIVAVAHSHPHGTPNPSQRDVRHAKRYPEFAMLICADGEVRAFNAAGEPLVAA